jgi:uncharacterized BrkB/YihY/UPF0761 family membrane protein
MKIKVRNGQPYIVLVYLLGLMMVGFAFIVLMKPLEITYNRVYDSPHLQDDVYDTFFTRFQSIWFWILLPIAIALLVWIVIKHQEREGYA